MSVYMDLIQKSLNAQFYFVMEMVMQMAIPKPTQRKRIVLTWSPNLI